MTAADWIQFASTLVAAIAALAAWAAVRELRTQRLQDRQDRKIAKLEALAEELEILIEPQLNFPGWQWRQLGLRGLVFSSEVDLPACRAYARAATQSTADGQAAVTEVDAALQRERRARDE